MTPAIKPLTMTTSEKIAFIQKDKFNNYNGRLLRPLKAFHSHIRKVIGDDEFLKFLEEREGLPKYEPINLTPTN